MAKNIDRYLIENEGTNQGTLKAALDECVQLCRAKSCSIITLLLNDKSAIGNLKAVLGEATTKELEKVGISKWSGLPLQVQTARTFSPSAQYEVVIGIHLANAGLAALNDIESAKAVILLPWLRAEGEEWLSTWRPTILGPNTWSVPPIDIPAQALESLKALSGRINKNTGLSHPSDKQLAQEKFKDLKKKGLAPDPDEVRKWALSDGWTSKHADALATMAKRYFR